MSSKILIAVLAFLAVCRIVSTVVFKNPPPESDKMLYPIILWNAQQVLNNR